MTRLTLIACLCVALTSPALALDATVPPVAAPAIINPAVPSAEQWQSVISAQIKAFRDMDAAGAMSFAAASFHTTYGDPKQFFVAIIAAGYSPIMDSVDESFGNFQMLGPSQVLQEVKLTSKDNSIFEAIYALVREDGGWRVSGVQLIKTPGIAA